jgi:hypothetical protein
MLASSRAGIPHAGVGAERRGEVGGKQRFKLVVELADPKVDRLRPAHQPVDLGELALQGVELGEVDPAQVLAHRDQHLRLILELLDLLVDALQRARGGQDVLRIVSRIEHDPAELRMGGRRRRHDAHDETAAGSGGEHGGDGAAAVEERHDDLQCFGTRTRVDRGRVRHGVSASHRLGGRYRLGSARVLVGTARRNPVQGATCHLIFGYRPSFTIAHLYEPKALFLVRR